ncbi:MAG: tRNA (adenosine(37)-N6)-threonylcarbamoyltransferase complex ATPase subunit type 1 TsaE [Thermosipho sp. (in: Bacteria)]|nr:tRNA (adenosine(37)-N6)-threonylcarbamoyltransferase complex ATPase subunit type 1 TsaE [Thermosipho sp. (in: thermotogales)]
MRFNSVTLEGLKHIADEIAKNINGYRFLFLNGDLGVGKTTFVKFFCENFGISQDEVSSPTFAVVNIYEGLQTIYHVDLYRLNDLDELFYVLEGQLEDEEGIFLIEWANLFSDYFTEDHVEVNIYHNDNNTRDLVIKVYGKNKKVIDELRRLKNGERFENKV